MFDIPVPDFTLLDNDQSLHDAEANEPEDSSIPFINGDTLADYMSNHDRNYNITILDCRFPYEYEAGHIIGAKSVNSPEIIENLFTDVVQNKDESLTNHYLIFHCEFSINRGPNMASTFRKIDRMINAKRYPFIFYPHVFILYGGFKLFFKKHQELCEGFYLPMWTIGFKLSVEIENRKRLISALLSKETDEQPPSFSLSQPIFLQLQ